ncbi:MAG: hypothetical protein U9Q37_05655 [Euryarchaeota archaeon]|nr:hypothetical protein [Euryarchaeota archaeon]
MTMHPPTTEIRNRSTNNSQRGRARSAAACVCGYGGGMTRLLLVVLIAAAVCMASAGVGAADGLNVTFYPFETEPIPCAPTPERPAFTTTDAVIALEIAVGSRGYDPRWDVSGDGQVTSLDALMILQASNGVIEL